MFRRQNQSLHACFFGDACDLIGIEVGRIEQSRIFITVSPLFISEGVDGEVYESIEFELVPLKLSRCGHRPKRFRGQRSLE